MLQVGLTGGIASGKTVVAEMFSALGAALVDTDRVARDVVAPGEPGLIAVTNAFGEGILTAQGTLDRTGLRRRVFQDPSQRQRLEAILHPLIRAQTLLEMENLRKREHPYCLIAVPLLVETGFQALVDRVLVVDCPRNIQLERLMGRDHQTRAEAENILAAQASRDSRLQVADDIIDNSGSLEETKRQVEQLHQCYLQLADALPGRESSRRIRG
jgi:dephospho-CoA kinase